MNDTTMSVADGIAIFLGVSWFFVIAAGVGVALAAPIGHWIFGKYSWQYGDEEARCRKRRQYVAGWIVWAVCVVLMPIVSVALGGPDGIPPPPPT